jgi:tetratricopeptide (TPR) repeat protein
LSGTKDQNHGARQDLHRALGWSFLKIGDSRAAEAHFAAALSHIESSEVEVLADARNGLIRAREAVAAEPEPELPAPPRATPLPEPTTAAAVATSDRAPVSITPPHEQPRYPPLGATSAQIRSELAANLAWAYYHRGLYDDALALFEQAIASNPDSLQARTGRGWTLLQRRQLIGARREFDLTISNPRAGADRLREPLRGRAWTRYHLRDYAGALDDFTRALEYADPGDQAVREELLRGRSRAAYHLGRYDLAAVDIGRRQDHEGRPVKARRTTIVADIYGSAIRWRLAKMRRALWRP